MYFLLLGSLKKYLVGGGHFPLGYPHHFTRNIYSSKMSPNFLLISWFFSQVSEEVFESFRSLARKQQEFQDQNHV
jgi:hypothetical protein